MARPWPNSPSYRDRPAARPGLTTIVQRAQTFTNASGAAVALTRKRGEEIECCVRRGRTAPPLGRSVLAQESLAALCISSGQQLWCHDVETDPRMRGAALFDPGVRSLVFTPISQGDQVIGVLAVFADAIDAFSAKHLLQLETAAGEIAEALGTEGRTPGEPFRSQPLTTKSDLIETDASKPKPPGSERLPLPARESIEPAQDAPAPAPLWKLETGQTTTPVATHRFATLDAMAARPRKPGSRKLALAATAVLLVIGGGATWAYLTMGARSAPQPVAAVPVQYAAPVAAGSQAASPGERATLKIDPEDVAIRKGSTFILNVAVSRAPDIGSLALQIDYDPKLVEFVKVSGGALLDQNGQQAVLTQRDDPAAGTLKISAQRPPGSPGVSGDGAALGLVFWGRETGSGVVSVAPGARDSQGRPVDVLGSKASVLVR